MVKINTIIAAVLIASLPAFAAEKEKPKKPVHQQKTSTTPAHVPKPVPIPDELFNSMWVKAGVATYPGTRFGPGFSPALGASFEMLAEGLPAKGRISAGLEARYSYTYVSSFGTSINDFSGPYGMNYLIEMKTLPFWLSGIARFKPSPGVEPFFGLGPGVAYVNSTLDLKSQYFSTRVAESATVPGFEIFGGMEIPVTREERIFGEIKYEYIPVDFKSTGALNAGGVIFNIGFRKEL